jgi:hypothetical protein
VRQVDPQRDPGAVVAAGLFAADPVALATIERGRERQLAAQFDEVRVWFEIGSVLRREAMLGREPGRKDVGIRREGRRGLRVASRSWQAVQRSWFANCAALSAGTERWSESRPDSRNAAKARRSSSVN